LKTVELSGGNLQALADSSWTGRAAWAPDGTILFRSAANSSLFRVPSAGGPAVPMQALSANDYSESDPAILPEGKHVLIVVSDKSQHRRIEFRSLTSSETKLALNDAEFKNGRGEFFDQETLNGAGHLCSICHIGHHPGFVPL
jgi:hypothetical protein